jgi:hypothetical protein
MWPRIVPMLRTISLTISTSDELQGNLREVVAMLLEDGEA